MQKKKEIHKRKGFSLYMKIEMSKNSTKKKKIRPKKTKKKIIIISGR